MTQIADYVHGLRRLKNEKMSLKVLIRAIFIMWIVAITVVSIMPHAEDGLLESTNLTESGMEKHFVAYFLAAMLCYYAFKRDDIIFILFLYSAALEVIQFFLPYRTFNIKDVVANASGIILFAIIWSLYLQISMRKQKS